DRLARDEDVALRRVARARAASGPRMALVAGVRRRTAFRVDDPQLAARAVLVPAGEALDGLVGAEPVAQEREPLWAVPPVRVGLPRDRPHVRLGPGYDRAARGELRLRPHAPLPRLEVARADRVRRNAFSHRSAPAGRARGGRGP